MRLMLSVGRRFWVSRARRSASTVLSFRWVSKVAEAADDCLDREPLPQPGMSEHGVLATVDALDIYG